MRETWAPAALGPRGEKAAARYLRRHGYRIITCNHRTRLGEIDIVAEHRADGWIAIVEVKSGRSENPPPEVHVNYAKRRKLTALAYQLIQQRRLSDRRVRFDVVAVVWPEGARQPSRITHHVNAFEACY